MTLLEVADTACTCRGTNKKPFFQATTQQEKLRGSEENGLGYNQQKVPKKRNSRK